MDCSCREDLGPGSAARRRIESDVSPRLGRMTRFHEVLSGDSRMEHAVPPLFFSASRSPNVRQTRRAHHAPRELFRLSTGLRLPPPPFHSRTACHEAWIFDLLLRRKLGRTGASRWTSYTPAAWHPRPMHAPFHPDLFLPRPTRESPKESPAESPNMY